MPTPGRSIVGAVGLGEAAGTDPAADFQPFRELCTVTAWSKNGGRRRQLYGGGECYSEWEYSFCVDTGSGTAECGYKSRTERTSCDKTTPTFVLGQGTTCWRPAPGFNPIGTSYRCGNKPLCYKIFDPADDVGTAANKGGAAFGMGLALLLVGETPLFRTRDPPHRSADTVCRLALLPQAVLLQHYPAGRTVGRTRFHHRHHPRHPRHRPRRLCLRAAVLKRWATSRPVALK